MVLNIFRSVAFAFIVLLQVSCERVPDWQLTSRSSGEMAAGIQSLQRWFWTCRGKQVSYKMTGTPNLVGHSIENFFDRFRNSGLSVVEVSADKTIMGTALLWDDSGVLLTQFEWVEQVEEIECRNDQIDWLPVRRLGQDRSLNLGILAVDLGDKNSWFRPHQKWKKRESALKLESETMLLASSYPGVLDRVKVSVQAARPVLHTGIDEELILFQPAAAEVMRGGVLVDEDLRFVGYLFANSQASWGMALSMSYVDGVIKSILKNGKVERAYLGMRVGFEPGVGFRVLEVEVSGPAYRAGLRVQDVVTHWNKKQMQTISDWPEVQFKDINRSVSITYQRGSKAFESQLLIASVQ